MPGSEGNSANLKSHLKRMRLKTQEEKHRGKNNEHHIDFPPKTGTLLRS